LVHITHGNIPHQFFKKIVLTKGAGLGWGISWHVASSQTNEALKKPDQIFLQIFVQTISADFLTLPHRFHTHGWGIFCPTLHPAQQTSVNFHFNLFNTNEIVKTAEYKDYFSKFIANSMSTPHLGRNSWE
jgi:hypothetical protein